MGPKLDSFTLFWAHSCATASSRLCGSDRQILKGVETRSVMPQFDRQHVLSRFFSFFIPLSTATFSTIMELKARAKSNGYRREAHREEDRTLDKGKYNN